MRFAPTFVTSTSSTFSPALSAPSGISTRYGGMMRAPAHTPFTRTRADSHTRPRSSVAPFGASSRLSVNVVR